MIQKKYIFDQLNTNDINVNLTNKLDNKIDNNISNNINSQITNYEEKFINFIENIKNKYKKEEKFIDSVLFATESKKFLSYKEIINSDI